MSNVEVTNPDRVLFPSAGYTKAEMVGDIVAAVRDAGVDMDTQFDRFGRKR